MSAAQQNWAEADSDDENHGRGGNDRRDQYPQNDSYQQSRQREPRPPTTAADVPMQGPFVAFIGNLPFSAVENDIGDYFHNGGCDVKDVMIKMGDDGRPRGMALVEFANRESLVKALSANGTNMMGRDIRSNLAPNNINSLTFHLLPFTNSTSLLFSTTSLFVCLLGLMLT